MEAAVNQKNANPRETANPFSVLFFTYTFGMFKKGYQKDLDVEDLYAPLSTDRSELLGGRLERTWNYLLSKSKKPKLISALARTFWPEYLYLIGLVAILDLFIQILNPYLLGKVLEYFKTDSDMQYKEAMMYGGGMVLTNMFNAILVNQYMLCAYHYGMKVRAACCSLIYRKALKLTNTALGETTSGKLVNLLSNDVSRFDIISYFVAYMFIAPFTALLIGYLLWREGGVWALVGMIPIFSVIPIHGVIGKLSAIFRRQTAFRMDERIRLMDEILSGIQVIKMYTWEIPFSKIIEKARKQELNIIKKLSYNRGIFMALGLFVNRSALFCTLISIFFSGKEISAQTVFVFMCYFNVLSQSISSFFARGLTEIAELMVIIKRIEQFMLKDEYIDIKNKKGDRAEYDLVLLNANAKWDTNVILHDISLKVKKGNLIGVVGTVGSGKTSLLQVILGELKLSSGEIAVNGSIAYVPQEPFIFVGTIRENILFGNDYDENKYNKVVQACALQIDFANFSSRDLCYIGERGISLSGGQTSRINLARALYRDSDIYLFDDPLSAVDVHVGNHIFEECINGYLSSKTRILVTHQVNFLKNADNIIVINNGNIIAKGKYGGLHENNTLFSNLMHKSPQTTKLKINDQLKNDKDICEGVYEISSDKMQKFREKSSKGTISGSLLLKYIFSNGNICSTIIVIFLFVLAQALASGVDYYVSFWINFEEQKKTSHNSTLTNYDVFNPSYTHMYIYSGLITTLLIMALTRSLLFYKLVITCSKKLHEKMYNSVVNTLMIFFHFNPSGRVLNRFSKDINSVDESLPKALLDAAQIILSSIGSLVLVVFVNPYFLIIVMIILFTFAALRNIFLKASKNIKRIEGIMRSPVFTHLNTTLQGITSIRAYDVQETATRHFDHFQNEHTGAWYMYITASSAFGFYLDLICCIFTAFITFIFITINNSSSIGIVGLAITQAISLTGIVQWGIRQSAEVANQLMSAERIFEYIALPSEKEPTDPIAPPSNWPSKGELTFNNVHLSYSLNSKPVLKNLSIQIKSQEKVGIVGRTGAGKSSIIQTLFRLAFVEGEIKIDGVDTSQIHLNTLRSNISIIPQEPVLFSGTLRYNLDPFEEYKDQDLFKALEEVELKNSLHLVNSLDSAVYDKGSNFSVGQRQLICLARAIIRRNRILVLDEATANVDPQTDELIQNTIRRKFADCTVLTIAHRLNTILDSDKIIVMDNGTIVEFDNTKVLLNNPQSIFYKMIAASD